MANVKARFVSNEDSAGEIFEKIQTEQDEIPVSLHRSGKDREWCVELVFQNETKEEIQKILSELVGSADARKFQLSELKDEDWVAKGLEGLKPVYAGRFVIHGHHDRDKVPSCATSIQIDAAQAFGTGHHGTTVGCLMEIDRLFKRRKFENCLDVGTGSGILAIAVSRLAKIQVMATDIDPVAVRTAEENFRINQVQSFVKIVCANGAEHEKIRKSGPYDLVLANILANPLVDMAGKIANQIAPRGTLVLSGLLEQDGSKLISAYSMQGLRFVHRTCSDRWLTLTFDKISK